MIQIAVKQISKELGLDCSGNTSAAIENLGKLDSTLSNTLSFAENKTFVDEALSAPNISAVVVKPEFSTIKTEKGLILSDEPKKAFYQIHEHLLKKTDFYRTDKKTQISASAQISEKAFIAAKNVVIGENARIGPNVSILEGTVIGKNVFVQPGAVIGSEGFECYTSNGKSYLVSHAGGVHIDEGVSIGANTCVDKALFRDQTYIGKYSHIDNLVHVGHGIKIGERVFIPAGVTLGGFVTINDDSFIGIGSVLKQRITVGKGSFVGMGAIVLKDVPSNTIVVGNPAKPLIKK